MRCPDRAAPGRMPGNGLPQEREEVPVFTPEQLASLLFGYRGPGEDPAGEKQEDPRPGEQELLKLLQPLRGVYFDEET